MLLMEVRYQSARGIMGAGASLLDRGVLGRGDGSFATSEGCLPRPPGLGHLAHAGERGQPALGGAGVGPLARFARPREDHGC